MIIYIYLSLYFFFTDIEMPFTGEKKQQTFEHKTWNF